MSIKIYFSSRISLSRNWNIQVKYTQNSIYPCQLVIKDILSKLFNEPFPHSDTHKSVPLLKKNFHCCGIWRTTTTAPFLYFDYICLLFFFLWNFFHVITHWWCNGLRARLECGRSLVRAPIWSNQKTIKLVCVASPLSTQQKEHRLASSE